MVGPVWTPTRRYSCPNGQVGSESHPSQLAEAHPPPTAVRNKEARDLARKCAYCGYHSASSLHLVARCPKFERTRKLAIAATGLEVSGDLFLHLDACSTKSCWITRKADPCPERRVRMQIALASVGLKVLFSPEEELQGLAHWTIQEEAQRILDQNELRHPPLPHRLSVSALVLPLL